MEEVLVVIVQALFEIGAEVLVNLPWDLFTYNYEKYEGNHTFAKCFLLFLIGVGAGNLSLLFLPKVLIHYPKIRMFNIAAAPLLSGYISLTVARLRRDRGDEEVVPARHFGYSFSACLGTVLFRFAFGAR